MLKLKFETEPYNLNINVSSNDQIKHKVNK
jgi:hypothetical protein